MFWSVVYTIKKISRDKEMLHCVSNKRKRSHTFFAQKQTGIIFQKLELPLLQYCSQTQTWPKWREFETCHVDKVDRENTSFSI